MKPATLLIAFATILVAAAPWLVAAEQSTTRLKSSAQDTVHRASKINGMDVKNKEDKKLGEIEDIVIDVTSGDVHYLALSRGGLLGVGNKLFAIPLDVFQLRRGEGEREFFLQLDLGEAALEKAPGFDEGRWPNFADKQWVKNVDGYYARLRQNNKNDGGASFRVQANDSGVSVDIDSPRDRSSEQAKKRDRTGDTIHRISKVTGMTVMNEANKELGQVDDVVIDMAEGKVKYLAVSYGGLLGVGDKLFAVPFDAFDCRPSDDEDEYYLVLNIDEDTLKKAPGFDKDRWPNVADPRWADDLDRHYGTEKRRAQRSRDDRRGG